MNRKAARATAVVARARRLMRMTMQARRRPGRAITVVALLVLATGGDVRAALVNMWPTRMPAAPAGSVPTPRAASTPTPSSPRRFALRPTFDDGIQFEIRTRRERPTPLGGPRLFADRTLVSGRVGARLQVDAVDYADRGHVAPVDGTVDLRRAFLNIGGDVRLRWPVRYYFEFGLLKEKAYLDRGWFDVRRPGGDLVVSVGQFYAPLGMDQLTSSNTITFLERAQPVQAFAPGNKAGVQASMAGDDRDLAWAVGGFTDTQRTDAADRSKGPARLVGRVTWAPRAAAPRLLHLGIAGQYVLSTAAHIRYKANPESYFAPALVDTGTIAASHAGVYGLELALQRGPLLLQSEQLGAVVAPDHDAERFLFGGYTQLSWLATGETRPYDHRRGAFGMPTPFVPFSPRERRWRGAVELGARYAYLDLDAGPVHGGRDHALSLGINWYWNRHVRVMADYAVTFVAGAKPNGSLQAFQTRLQLVY